MKSSVMLVDDNDYIRESVAMLFDSNGIKVVTVASGDECLGQLRSGFRGIILMDVMMPVMDGWDTIREIVRQEMFAGNIIIMLTAKGEPDMKMDGIQEFIADYITKPFDPKSLLDAVARYDRLRMD